MTGLRIHFIRHGITEANEQGVYVGLSESPISALGKKELEKKTDDFIYPEVDKVYVSPLKRCIATASFIYPHGYARVVPELREMNFGDFEGKKATELQGRPDYMQFLKGGLDNPPPNGESLRSVTERCIEAVQFIVEDAMKNGYKSVAVVTHGGIIMNIMGCFGLPKMSPSEFACDFGEGFSVMVSAQLWQLSNAFEILGRLPYEKYQEGDSEYSSYTDEA
ncbi:MAG: histidine phosphatase family protein [Oscillospiraceae bacterium]|nr:histidine phosphatase family protein [Oscillospiraceae bacterium]